MKKWHWLIVVLMLSLVIGGVGTTVLADQVTEVPGLPPTGPTVTVYRDFKVGQWMVGWAEENGTPRSFPIRKMASCGPAQQVTLPIGNYRIQGPAIFNWWTNQPKSGDTQKERKTLLREWITISVGPAGGTLWQYQDSCDPDTTIKEQFEKTALDPATLDDLLKYSR